AATKMAALWLGFVVVTFGCLFVLKGVEASYQLSIAKGEDKSAFATSSPGLVLITFGTVPVVVAMVVKSTITVGGGDSSAPRPPAPSQNASSTLPKDTFDAIR